MRALIRLSAFSVFFLVLAVTAAGAQQRMITAEPIDPADPRAQRAAGLVQLILTGDAEAALAHAAEHGAPGLHEAEGFKADLRTIVAELGTGDFLTEALDRIGPELIGVRLRNTTGGPPRIVVVGIEPGAPYRITQLRAPRMQMRFRTPDGR